MHFSLIVNDKLGFVDNTSAKSSYKETLLANWERYDVVVISWLSAIVAPEFLTSIIYVSHSKKIQDNFKERLDKSNLIVILLLMEGN